MTIEREHPGGPVDLVVRDARLLVTMDGDREIPDGWVAIDHGFVVGVGGPGSEPPARATIDASGCLVTPGLINTHHHIFQNLTRSYRPATKASLFDWLTTLYPLWAKLDEDAIYASSWIGFAELALGGCTTTTDHLYVHPEAGGDLLGSSIAAAAAFGMRFHPTRGSMSRSADDGGLPPASVVQSEERILADSADAVARFHDPHHGAMVKIALAPCSPFSVSPDLMRRTAEMAADLDVRLHTHLAEDPDEDAYCLETFGVRPIDLFESVGWLSDRSWVAHCVYPNADEIVRLGAAGVGVAHCPSSNMMIADGLAPIAEFLEAGVHVGLGCDGSASTDAASLWLESRTAMLLARVRRGPASFEARDALTIATLGGASCLGRSGEIGVLTPGSAGDLVVWPVEGVPFAGAFSDAVEAWLRCGPTSARDTVIAGRRVVADGRLVSGDLDRILADHTRHARRIQGLVE